MPFSVDQELGTGCGSCVEQCLAEAIESDRAVATIDDYLCILRGVCQVICPQNVVLYDGKPYQPDAPAAIPLQERSLRSVDADRPALSRQNGRVRRAELLTRLP